MIPPGFIETAGTVLGGMEGLGGMGLFGNGGSVSRASSTGYFTSGPFGYGRSSTEWIALAIIGIVIVLLLIGKFK